MASDRFVCGRCILHNTIIVGHWRPDARIFVRKVDINSGKTVPIRQSIKGVSAAYLPQRDAPEGRAIARGLCG